MGFYFILNLILGRIRVDSFSCQSNSIRPTIILLVYFILLFLILSYFGILKISFNEFKNLEYNKA